MFDCAKYELMRQTQFVYRGNILQILRDIFKVINNQKSLPILVNTVITDQESAKNSNTRLAKFREIKSSGRDFVNSFQ